MTEEKVLLVDDDAEFTETQSVKDLMTLAIEFEKDTILFYEMLRPFIGDKQAEIEVDKIISEENKHIEKMTSFLNSGCLPA